MNNTNLISGEHDPKKFKAMEIYTILMELNRKMIFGEEISDAEKSKAVSFFLDGICEKDEIVKYKKRMGVNTEADNIYPNYYIPPYDGNKKLRLIQGYLIYCMPITMSWRISDCYIYLPLRIKQLMKCREIHYKD